MLILTTDMFKGPGMNNLSLDNTTTATLQATINQWERYYLYQLLSNNTPNTLGLADLFVANLNNGVPSDARFLEIYNSFNQQMGGHMWSSRGMKETFKSIIAYHYITENSSYSGTGGITSGNSSGSKTLEITNAYRWAESRFNDALDSIDAIKWWLRTGNGNGGGPDVYPEYVNTYWASVFKAKYQSVL